MMMMMVSEIRTKLLPTLCNRTPSDDERELVGLPTRLGGLGIHNPTEIATTLHQCAVHATTPLVDLMLQHQNNAHADDNQPVQSKSFQEALADQRDAVKRNREVMDACMRDKANALRDRLGSDSTTALATRWAEEHGTSTWLAALPLVSHGFDLTRREFYDALCLSYGWEPSMMPMTCACGQ